MMGDEFTKRSALRKHEALNRKLRRCGVIHEAHVREFYEALPKAWQRVVKVCSRCGRVLRAAQWPKDRSGKALKHCGCVARDFAISPRSGTSKYGIKPADKNEYKRMARLMAFPGFKAVKHDAHVFARKCYLSALERQQRLERYKQRLTNSVLSIDEQRAEWRKEEKRQVDALSNRYVTRLLKKSMPTLLNGVKLPKELIDLERVRLMIVREVKQRNRYEEL
jgi:hypothetical protein